MNNAWTAITLVAGLVAATHSHAQNCPSQYPDQVTDILTLVQGNTICAASNGDQWQEYHRSDGALIDYKKGPSDTVDPTTEVGSWSAAQGKEPELSHTYDSSSFAWIVCESDPGGSYALVGVSTITGVSIIGGQASCGF